MLRLLRRQLDLKRAHAMELYARLAEHREGLEKEEATASKETQAKGKEKKKEEKRAKPNSAAAAPPPPPVLSSAPPAMQLADYLPPYSASGPPLPPPQGAKRHHNFSEPQAAKRVDSSFVPRVGEWKCGKCTFWNMRWNSICRGRKDSCGVPSWDNTAKHVTQMPAKGVEAARVSGAKRWGDWRCRCSRWNRSHYHLCGKCHGEKADCLVGQDFSLDLEHDPPGPEHGYLVSNNYWNEERHPEAYNSSSASQYQRDQNVPAGAKGRFRERRSS